MPTPAPRQILERLPESSRGRGAIAVGVAAFMMGLLAVQGGTLSVVAALAGAVTGFVAGELWRRTAGPDTPSAPSLPIEPPAIQAPAPAPPPVLELTVHGLIDALPVPAIVVDEAFIVRHANRPARDVFTALRQGGPIALASRAPEFARAIEAVLTDGKTERVLLHERVPVERRLDASLSPLDAASGNVGAVLIVLHDISERDRLAQMRADFIAHASHELRTPLAALRGFIETLQGPARNDAVARERFLGIMASESHRMSRLLDDLLSLSRVEMRAHLPPTGEVEIVETVREVIESLAQIATAQGTEVTLDAPGGARMIRGDHDEIVQVFVNLLQNAIKYGRKDGHVRIAVSDNPGGTPAWVRVSVTDDGPGIAEEHIPRLTERFYRVDDKSSREKGGTGLGLAIVKHVVTRHQGELRIDSRLGVGSTFAVEFPLKSEN